ncbi:MAG TPA: cupredoxin domain-containing protein [Symbiobacteriaceae bacterium]|nr:cupredoxin domain-containing protein [Symbiobacteriaceae bacterium]
MKHWQKAALAVAMVGLLAGCSAKANAPAETVTVKAENTSFATKEITVEKGKTYQLVLDNKDVQLHDFSIDKISAKVEGHQEAHGHDTTNKNPDLHVQADAGKSGTLTFTPSQQGTFTFYCTVPGHKDAGMQGKLIVK